MKDGLEFSGPRPRPTIKDTLLADRAKLMEALRERGGGSALRGWRRELDPDGSLDLGFQEFCRAMTRLGVEVDAIRLFGTDGDNSMLTLEELAPSEGRLVQRFRTWTKTKFGSPSAMFSALDTGDKGVLTRENFVSGLRASSFEASSQELGELFNLLDVEDFGTVTEQDIMFLETDKVAREQEIFRAKMRSKHQRQRLLAYMYWDDGRKITKSTDRRANRPWLADNFERLPTLVTSKRLTWQHDMHRRAVEARTVFLAHLRGVFGHEVRAWRRGLDTEGHFAVDKMTLYRYCRRADLAVDLASLWRGMDRDGDDKFTMEELDPPRALALAGLRSWAHQSFGSCCNVWDQPLMVAARGRPQLHGRWVSDKKLLLGAFSDVLKRLGWPGTGSAEADSLLCSSLDLYGCGFISQPDLWWLDAWDPPEYLVEHPDPGAWAELRELMLKQCGHPLRAWRSLLDTNGNNRVCWGEFLVACRRLRFRGSPGAAWRCLDQNFDGVIGLREYDAASAELLDSFKTWAETSFGSVELAFKAFDADGSGTLTYAELRRGCQRLQWQGEVRLLFNCLSGGTAPGTSAQSKRSLMLADVAFLDAWQDDSDIVKASMADELANVTEASEQKILLGPPRFTPARPRLRSSRAEKGDGGSCNNTLKQAFLSGRDITTSTYGTGAYGYGSLVNSSSASDFERLHRTYHCVKQAPRNKGLTKAKSGPLPWLEKLNRIDAEYAEYGGIG